ncbi:MAG: 4-diphosphocytidyl-2-C-methyl-D-erythritol kinase, partial [Bacteroidota bacterium]|nr:4-diphosphocytidyl-2-C-methyl-D-erythritol kinase [Bacteroidota bacterium]
DFRELLLRAKEKPEQLRHTIWNDFETPAFGKYPEIKKIKNDLYKYGAIFALLSGSGSSVYGFYRNREEADLAARQFAKFESFVCEPLREGF